MEPCAPRFRGAVWLDGLSHIREAYGDKVVDAAFDALAQEHRQALSGLLPISWVEVAPVMAWKNAVAEQLGMSGPDFQRLVVRAGVRRTVRGFWRFIVRKMWDDALAKRLPILYSRTFEFGELKVVNIGQGSAELQLLGWPNMHDYDALGLATGMETIFDLAGRRGTRVTFRKACAGDETRFDVRWAPAS